ncbi:hypothetical protein C8J57DRAFT_1253618 [Mycena rebaudengoi]|nr:hypothetical protein C8J57DRAFT_1253618 [Mycena rebaudengoi]
MVLRETAFSGWEGWVSARPLQIWPGIVIFDLIWAAVVPDIIVSGCQSPSGNICNQLFFRQIDLAFSTHPTEYLQQYAALIQGLSAATVMLEAEKSASDSPIVCVPNAENKIISLNVSSALCLWDLFHLTGSYQIGTVRYINIPLNGPGQLADVGAICVVHLGTQNGATCGYEDQIFPLGIAYANIIFHKIQIWVADIARQNSI